MALRRVSISLVFIAIWGFEGFKEFKEFKGLRSLRGLRGLRGGGAYEKGRGCDFFVLLEVSMEKKW